MGEKCTFSCVTTDKRRIGQIGDMGQQINRAIIMMITHVYTIEINNIVPLYKY